jgi:O-antigen/teichoic acid export membrane protein
MAELNPPREPLRRLLQLRTDMFSYGAVAVLRHGIGFITLPLYVKTLSQESFAALDLVLSTVAFLSLTILQLNVGYARYFYDGGSHPDRVGTMFTVFATLGVTVAVLGAPSAYFLAPKILTAIPGISLAAAFAVGSFLPQVLFEFFLMEFRLRQIPRIYAYLALTDAVLRFSLIAVCVPMLRLGLPGFFFALMLASSLACAAGFWAMGRGWNRRFDAAFVRRVLRFVVPTLPGVGVRYLTQYGVRFIMLGLFSLVDVAIFALSVKIGSVAKFGVQAFRQAWLPLAMESIDDPHGGGFYRRVLDLYAVMAVFVVGASALLAKPLILMLSAPQYLPAAAFVAPLTAALLVNASTSVTDLGNQSAEKTHWSSIAFALGAAVNLPVSIAGSGRWGIASWIAGSVLGAIVSATVTFLSSQRNRLFPFRPVAIVVVVLGLPLEAVVLTHLINMFG